MAKNSLPPMTHVGLEKRPFVDTYHQLLSASWGMVVVWIAFAFFVYNGLFTILYLLGGDCIGANDPSSVLEAFSFSVQTMTSTGYGAMSPRTPYAHILTIFESFGGLLGTAMSTGLIFAKFARPTARIAFSDKIVVTEFDGLPTLQFRVSNQRQTQVVDAKIQVNALLAHESAEGQSLRRLHTMHLLRDQTPAFRLSWTVIHVLDELSPVQELGDRAIPENLVAILVTVIGLDEGFSQTVHAQATYQAEDIVFDHQFVDMMSGSLAEGLTIDHRRLHDLKPTR